MKNRILHFLLNIFCLLSLCSASENHIIGIDIGTSYSRVAVFKKGFLEYDFFETPSYVSYTRTGKVLAGEEAYDKQILDPINTVFDIKLMIGRDFTDPAIQNGIKWWPFEVIHKFLKTLVQVETENQSFRLPPEKLYGQLLKYLKKRAEKLIGENINEAVISVPFSFDLNQRELIKKESVKTAGFKYITLINETNAAEVFLSTQINESLIKIRKGFLLILKLGAGFFDTSLLQVFSNGEIHELYTKGSVLGTINFVNNIADHLAEKFKKETGKHSIDFEDMKQLKLAAEICMKDLDDKPFTLIEIKDVSKAKPIKINFTYEEFEKINENLFKAIKLQLIVTLYGAKVNADEVSQIALQGYGSRIKEIRNILMKVFDRVSIIDDKQNCSIAIGALKSQIRDMSSSLLHKFSRSLVEVIKNIFMDDKKVYLCLIIIIIIIIFIMKNFQKMLNYVFIVMRKPFIEIKVRNLIKKIEKKSCLFKNFSLKV